MHGIRALATIAVAVSATFVIATHAQQGTPATVRALISDGELPGIDRGLRTIPTPGTALLTQALRTRIDTYIQAYLPDSLNVKFRPGVSAAALRSMLALVDGTSMTRQPNADF